MERERGNREGAIERGACVMRLAKIKLISLGKQDGYLRKTSNYLKRL
jgi:hypothetical protein